MDDRWAELNRLLDELIELAAVDRDVELLEQIGKLLEQMNIRLMSRFN
jgi:hypothetical protein